jgi:hypothetical protein
MLKLNRLIELIKTLIDQLFTGQVVLHFNKGSLCKVEKHEHISI